MAQLFFQTGGGFTAWSSGAARYFTDHNSGSRRLSVAVNCRLGNLEVTDIALCDTGAEWSVVGGDTAELLEEYFGPPIRSVPMDTRFGRLVGDLRNLDIHLLADPDMGAGVKVESTVLVIKEWPGPTVLGFHGFLEKLRFALDPGVAPDQEIIYFGAVG